MFIGGLTPDTTDGMHAYVFVYVDLYIIYDICINIFMYVYSLLFIMLSTIHTKSFTK